MARGPAPQWRKRNEPVVDDYILASVEQAGGIGKHNPSGHYATLIIRDLATRDEATEWHKALHRCAHYLSRNRIADVSMSAKIKRDGTKYLIEFKAIDKTRARQYIIETYGPDRSKWPYDPRRRGNA